MDSVSDRWGSLRNAALLCDGGADTGARSPQTSDGVVLVVDDDKEFAETVKLWLERDWEVILAFDGDEVLEKYGPHVDVVLLDRRMPTMSGDEALEKLREQEGDARIAMVTAVDPGWDIVEMDFDTYVSKPVGEDEIRETVRTLFSRAQYAREIQALFALSSKLAMLESRDTAEELDDDERYHRMEDELDRLRHQSQDKLAELEGEEFEEVLQIIEDET